MSAFRFPLGESAQRKGKNLKIERREILVSGLGQDILDSPLLSPWYPALFFSNALAKACLSFSQMLIWRQNSGRIFCFSSSLLEMVREQENRPGILREIRYEISAQLSLLRACPLWSQQKQISGPRSGATCLPLPCSQSHT